MGVWVSSQDRSVITYCKTVKAWKSGRIVNNIGKDYVHLGDYSSERAKEILVALGHHLNNASGEIFQMPLK